MHKNVLPFPRKSVAHVQPATPAVPIENMERAGALMSDWLWSRLSHEGRVRLLREHNLLAPQPIAA